MAINVSVKCNGGFFPDIKLLTLWGTRLKTSLTIEGGGDVTYLPPFWVGTAQK